MTTKQKWMHYYYQKQFEELLAHGLFHMIGYDEIIADEKLE